MELSFTANGVDNQTTVDLDDLIDNYDMVVDADTMHTALVVQVAQWALEQGVGFDDLYPQFIQDDNSNELWVHGDSQSNPDWIKEVAQFAWFIRQEKDSWVDDDLIYAWVEGEGWQYCDFDSLKDYEDYYSQEYDGDAEEFGRNWLHEVGEGLSDDLDRYFDYEAYGEDLLNSYQQYTWNGTTYLFHEH